MKRALAIVTLSFMLAASQAADGLPNVQLTKELLYDLMRAELDFREGRWQAPYNTMLAAAKATGDPRLARRAAEMAHAAAQPEQALAAVKLWRTLAPQSEEAQQYYLGFLVMADDLAEAEKVLAARLAAAEPAARGASLFQAQQLLSRANDRHAAALAVQRLATPYEGVFEAHIVLAQSHLMRKERDEAGRHAQLALALKPDSELAALALAHVTANDEEAAAHLARFLERHPNAREVRAARARILVNQLKYREAYGEFSALLKQQPDNMAALYAAGVMAMQLEDMAGAEKYFERYMAVLAVRGDDDRDPTKVLALLAQLAEERRDYRRALGWLERIEPGDEGPQLAAQLKRAQLIAKLGDVKGGRAALDAMVPLDPQAQAQVAVAHGQLLREAGQAPEAFELLQVAARRHPDNPDLLYDFALAAEKVGRLDLMEQALRSVIAQAPANHHAYNALGYSLAERNVRLGEARELIEQAHRMAPGDPFILDSMGWVQYRLGNLKAAEELLRRAYALRDDADIAVHLGEVLWKLGMKADAQRLFREARAKDPQNGALRDTLARLNTSL
jgi:tetratricopeptide (TPR) repeat protein